MDEIWIELKGWKRICRLLKVKSRITAKKRLEREGLLCYEHGRPVLSVDAFKIVVMQRHLPGQ